jgi:hypothetical protein
VFKEIVDHYLKQIRFEDDKLASSIRLSQYGEADVVLDPRRGYGQPVFDRSGVRVSDVLGPLQDDIFIDRSLGAVRVPALLRAAGLALTTMREHYGELQAQSVTDHGWIALTAERNWIGFHKDASIRRNEKSEKPSSKLVRGCSAFPRADLVAEELAARFIANTAAISPAAQSRGPFIYSVPATKVIRLL